MSVLKITGAARVAGVVGRPIAHSLSPMLHNAWIAAANIDAVYAPFSPPERRFPAFVEGFRGGVVCGLNVTLPFKEAALAAADEANALARGAGAANLLLFHADGRIEAQNTDGEGLIYAFARQTPALNLCARPMVIIGAGGAARGAVAALLDAGVSDIRVVNRTKMRAERLATRFSKTSAWGFERLRQALDGAGVIINATSAEVGGSGLDVDLAGMAPDAVAMDMLYRPLTTAFLTNAKAQGLQTVDGLDMLIGQAIPSFEAFFGIAPPASVDARALLLDAMGGAQ
jgi:shikimate dehydrogenase